MPHNQWHTCTRKLPAPGDTGACPRCGFLVQWCLAAATARGAACRQLQQARQVHHPMLGLLRAAAAKRLQGRAASVGLIRQSIAAAKQHTATCLWPRARGGTLRKNHTRCAELALPSTSSPGNGCPQCIVPAPRSHHHHQGRVRWWRPGAQNGCDQARPLGGSHGACLAPRPCCAAACGIADCGRHRCLVTASCASAIVVKGEGLLVRAAHARARAGLGFCGAT